MIEVQKIVGKGRGIIATKNIPQGTLLEVSPVGVFPYEQRHIINKTEVFKYYFVQQTEYAEGKNLKGYIVFGLASLCNHLKESNSYIEWVENEVGVWSHWITKKDIKAGEEVTMSYTNIDEYYDAEQFV